MVGMLTWKRRGLFRRGIAVGRGRKRKFCKHARQSVRLSIEAGL